MVGHGFMTEDMVIEDGEGRRFEPENREYADFITYLTYGVATPSRPLGSSNHDDIIVTLVHGTTGLNYFAANNIHVLDWGGNNYTGVRRSGSIIIADYIYSLASNNLDATKILLGYSHGGNVNKGALDILFLERGFDLGNIILANTGTPILDAYSLNMWTSLNLLYHLNFFNESDTVQSLWANFGTRSSLSTFRPIIDGVQVSGNGRAARLADNRRVEEYMPGLWRSWNNFRNFDVNWFGSPAHRSMREVDVMRHYIIPAILEIVNGGGCGD